MTNLSHLWARGNPVALTEEHVTSILLVRRARRDALGNDIFSDPAWDIILELYGAWLGGRRCTPTELAVSIETPLSTTTRWLIALNQRGLIEAFDKNDKHAPVSLTNEGASKMEQLGNRWASAFLAIA